MKKILLSMVVFVLSICFMGIEAGASSKHIILNKGETCRVTGGKEFYVFDSIDVPIPNAKGSSRYDLLMISPKGKGAHVNVKCTGDTVYPTKATTYYVTCKKDKLMIHSEDTGKNGIKYKKVKKPCFDKYLLKRGAKMRISSKSSKGVSVCAFGKGSKINLIEKRKGKTSHDTYELTKNGIWLTSAGKRTTVLIKNATKATTLILSPNYRYLQKITGVKKNNNLILSDGKVRK